MELSIDSRGTGLSNADKRKNKDLFIKELAEKKKSLDQLLSACYEEAIGVFLQVQERRMMALIMKTQASL